MWKDGLVGSQGVTTGVTINCIAHQGQAAVPQHRLRYDAARAMLTDEKGEITLQEKDRASWRMEKPMGPLTRMIQHSDREKENMELHYLMLLLAAVQIFALLVTSFHQFYRIISPQFVVANPVVDLLAKLKHPETS